jgi:hypothetical protein
MEHYKEKGKVPSVEQVPTLLMNDEKLNIQQIEKGDAISILKD